VCSGDVQGYIMEWAWQHLSYYCSAHDVSTMTDNEWVGRQPAELSWPTGFTQHSMSVRVSEW
jgi:hypothetical protein